MLITIDNGQFVFAGIAWILTRERQPTAEIVKEARKVLEDNKISTAFLLDTVQSDCAAQNVTLTESYVFEPQLNAWELLRRLFWRLYDIVMNFLDDDVQLEGREDRQKDMKCV